MFAFSATNNEAEYQAIITRFDICKTLEATNVILFGDSQLLIHLRFNHLSKYQSI